jgi:Flp pilus assembly protein TadG
MSRPATRAAACWRSRRATRPGSEQGSITLMLAAMFVGLLAMFGIVIDGGIPLSAAENADAVAQEAARAGAGMVNQSAVYSTGTFQVDQQQALAAARAYLSRGGWQGSVRLSGRASISVRVTITEPTKVLSLIGIDSMRSTGSATASLVAGVTGPGA